MFLPRHRCETQAGSTMEASSAWCGIALSGDGLERKLFLQKQFEL